MPIHVPSQTQQRLEALGVGPPSSNQAEYYEKITQRSEEWIEIRRLGLGASELPMVANLSPHGNGNEVLENKRHGRKQTRAMKAGSEKEDEIAAAYVRECGKRTRIREVGLYSHQEFGFLLASPDRLQTSPGLKLIELKYCTSSLPTELPQGVKAQVAMQMAVTKPYIFEPTNCLPEATVVYMNKSGLIKMFDLEWSDVQNWWEEELLPTAYMFYINHLLPEAEKYARSKGIHIPRSPGSRSAAQRKRKDVEAACLTPIPDMGPIQDTIEERDAEYDPQIEEGCWVWVAKKSKPAKVCAIVKKEGKERAVLRFEDNTPMISKPCKLDSLVRMPVPPSQAIRPQHVGQKVQINGGSGQVIQYVGKVGVVETYGVDKCHIRFDGEEKLVGVRVANLHCLEKDFQQPTVAAKEGIVRLPAKEGPAYLAKIQIEGGYTLIGNSLEQYMKELQTFEKVS